MPILKRVLVIFGTRPEAIKVAPVIKALEKEKKYFETKICVTAQHREMLDDVLRFFEISPHYDLNLMSKDQNLFSLTAKIIGSLKGVLEEFNPDYVLVHGDTTTSMASSLASFYYGTKICHIEAGLRTNNKLAPFPEEINRQLTSRLTDFHFAPTEGAKNNLLRENIEAEKIFVTGNTVIDSLLQSVRKVRKMNNEQTIKINKFLKKEKKLILVTSHRRENFGRGFINICNALIELSGRNDVQIIYPVHLNPHVRAPVYKMLNNNSNILLIDPLSYPSFVWLMNKSKIIITDSGGVQEEAPSLGKPVLVMRDVTERPEAVKVGTVILVGTNKVKIIRETIKLIENRSLYQKMSKLHNPYGDGKSAKRIVSILKENATI